MPLLTFLNTLSSLFFSFSVLHNLIVGALYPDTRNTYIGCSSQPALVLPLARLRLADFALGQLFATGLSLFICFVHTVDGMDGCYAC